MAEETKPQAAAPAPSAAAPAGEAAAKKAASSSAKRLRQNTRRSAMNTPVLTSTKHLVARAGDLMEAGDKDAAAAVQKAVSALDRAATKGVIHRNNAARRKSRLLRRLNKAQAK